MRTLINFAISQIYGRLRELDDKLVDTRNMIDWEGFRPMLEDLYDNNRPNIDVIIMLKALFIQQLYCLSDEQPERELTDRSSLEFSWVPQRLFQNLP